MEILRRGSEGNEVRNWQHFLLGLGLLVDSSVDAVFGPRTETATKAFQKKQQLTQDGMVGPRTYAAAIAIGFDPGFVDPLGGTSGPDWPPPPNFRPLISNLERGQVFGKFEYRRKTPGRDDIVILGDWAAKNIVAITVPQLRGVKGAPASGRIHCHRLVREQFMAQWMPLLTSNEAPLSTLRANVNAPPTATVSVSASPFFKTSPSPLRPETVPPIAYVLVVHATMTFVTFAPGAVPTPFATPHV